MRGKSWARQILSDAKESMIAETKLAMEAGQGFWSRNLWKLSVENSTSCMRILKLTDTWEVVRDTRCLFGKERWQAREDEIRERVGKIIERSLAGEARMKILKDRIAERSESKRWEELELSEVQEMCLRNLAVTLGNKDDEQVSVRQVSSYPCVAREYLVSGEIQSRQGFVLVQKSGGVDDDIQISALDALYGKDGRRSRLIGDVFGAVSRRRCRRSQEKRIRLIGWELDMSQRSREENLEN